MITLALAMIARPTALETVGGTLAVFGMGALFSVIAIAIVGASGTTPRRA